MQTINLHIYEKNIIPALYTKQGDVGRKFKAVIADGIPDGVTFSVWYSGASGAGNYTHIGDRSAFAVEGSTVTVELITQMLTNAGAGYLCLVMSGVDGSQLATWNIPYEVEHVPGMGSAAAEQYYTAFSETAKKVAADAARAEAAAAKFDILTVFPVGYIYMSVSAISPATLFGGTWERIKDTFLLSAGDAYAAGSTGGEATHTLTSNEMPSHNHAGRNGESGTLVYADGTEGASTGFAVGWNKRSEREDLPYLKVADSGGDQPHNNMPPYLAVYVWKRVA